jgi:PAS domain S-box-containing protein
LDSILFLTTNVVTPPTWRLSDNPMVTLALVLVSAAALAWAIWLLVVLRGQRDLMRRRDVAQTNLETLYTELVERASDVIFQLDAEGRIVAINEAGAKMLGIKMPELLGRKLSDFLPASEKDRLAVEGSKEYNLGELTLVDNQGRPVHLETSFRRQRVDGKVKSVEVIARNVTERRQFEAQIRQSERMQAMGFLAGGVAHDFNNYLTVILTYVDLALETIKDKDSELTSLLQEIRKTTRSASGMAQMMLDFSRGHVLPPRPMNLNELVTGMQRMLQSALGKKNVQIDLQLTPQLPSIIADRGSIEQVILNLALNARDAMPQGGRLGLRTSVKNSNVVLEISDTGQGMDAQTKGQIFQPFFTTKEEGKGTGLGLATVQRIVIKSGGKIQVESTPGQGTTFRIEFPTATHGDISREALAERSHSPPRFF